MNELIASDGRRVPLDDQGYLVDIDAWAPWVAEAMASDDDIELTERHWAVIDMLRAYYREYDIAPPMRALLKIAAARLGEDFADSRQLYRLFPDGPARQACRYAGLPKPVSCI
ncbi:MAG: TusE/DsrC/DsvC family sulfur relay protein [Xanthomonadales bacterium]|nr:TusE/DsrC/DsvC family sulfur relay protein [Xanthomonadales bacterium]